MTINTVPSMLCSFGTPLPDDYFRPYPCDWFALCE